MCPHRFVSILLYHCCENDMPQSLAVLSLSDNPRTSWRSLADSSVEFQRLPWGSLEGPMQYHVFIKANEFVQFSRPLALQDFVFLQSGLVQLNPVGESLPSDCNQGTKISGAPRVGSGRSWWTWNSDGSSLKQVFQLPTLKAWRHSNAVGGCIQYIGSTVLFLVITSKMNVLP